MKNFLMFLGFVCLGSFALFIGYQKSHNEIQSVKEDLIMDEGGIKEIRSDLNNVKTDVSSIVAGFDENILWRDERTKNEIKDRIDVNRRLEDLEKKVFSVPQRQPKVISQSSKASTKKTKVNKSEYKKVMIKGFPEDSIATRVATKIYNERGMDMLTTIIGENGGFKLDQQSNYRDKNGNRERSFGLCQLMYIYHKDFINSPDFQSREKQAEYCIEVRDDAVKKGRLKTTFYAYNTRRKHKSKVLFY